MCTINEDHIVYCSWDIRCDGQLFVILDHFLPFDLPNNPKYQDCEKWKKAWGYYHLILVYRKWRSYDVWFLRYGARQIEFFVILGHVLLFYPTNNSKNQILKKWKNNLEISSFYTCVPQMTIIWCMVPEIWSTTDIIFMSFWTMFCPFYLLRT